MSARAGAPSLRVAVLGAGPARSAIVPGLVHALTPAAGGPPPFTIELAVDEQSEAWGAEVRARAGAVGGAITVQAADRPAALEGATLVLCLDPVPLPVSPQQILAECGWRDAPPVGAPAVLASVLAGPGVLDLARSVTARAPDALLVMMGSLPDVLAGAARRRFGVGGLRAVGMGTHLGTLRLRLARLFGAAPERLALVHGGVHRVGWVLRFGVDGRDGYSELPDRLAPDAGLREVWELTGLIPTVCDAGWPWGPSLPGPVEEPEGMAIGRLVRAVATGEPDVVGLDVPFAGEALSWPPEVTAEVPAVVVGTHVDPVAVGPLPPGADGLPRLLALQRGLVSDYLANPDPAILLRALAATPQWGTPRQWRRLVSNAEAAVGESLARAVRP